MESRIPLLNRQKPIPRYPLTAIDSNRRICDLLANTKPCGNVLKNHCSICLHAKKPPPPSSFRAKKPPPPPPSSTTAATPKRPPLDDYKERYKNLLGKFEILNNNWTVTKSELDEFKKANEILQKKLATAEAEVKSTRHDFRRLKTTNRTNELTIGVLQRKIDELQADKNEELPSTRSGRNVRPPEKYQSNTF